MSSDPLEELRARVAAAQEATERLARETASAREEAAGLAGAEIHALAAAARSVRALLPDDLWEQLCDLIRGLLMLMRAILDRWIEALREPAGAAPLPREIPID
jgi:uncharacterized alpha-E superfamily protein